jgi:mono/diheme cytochrome c family protein
LTSSGIHERRGDPAPFFFWRVPPAALRRTSGTITLRVLKYSIAHSLLLVSVAYLAGCGKPAEPSSASFKKPNRPVTFNEDIAPVVFKNCSECHRPGGAGPFNLLTYNDVQKRARQIVEVTRERIMPPWLPDPAVVHFIGERQLTAQELGLIREWAASGAVEGAGPPPVPPTWNERWQLGEPDLVVKVPTGFSLPADGPDVYRNFVIPMGMGGRRFVRGLEFRANSRAVHHAFFRFDKTGQARLQDGRDGRPGFGGIHTPRAAESPVTFASWQPGKTARFYSDDLAWPVETNTDLVLQLHLQPIGRVEPIAAEVGFFFTDHPGTAVAFKLPLNSLTMEIPAGASNYVTTDALVLPVDVEVRAVLPHAHYLCRTVKGYAELPGGKRQWLISIPQWDFNWQGDYQLTAPMHLPKGTRLVMEYTYDNSTNNPRNPNHPPKTVRYGVQSADEMAELWLQVVMKSRQDFAALQRALQPKFIRESILVSETVLRDNPRDARAYCDIGSALLMQGQPADALVRLRKAIEIDPDYDEAHYFTGLAHRMEKRLEAAEREFEATIRINPGHARARGNLGLVLSEQGNLAAALQQFEMALQLNPDDEIARDMIARIRQATGSRAK